MPDQTSIADLRKQYNSLIKEKEVILPVWKQLADNFLPLKRVLLDEKYKPEDVYNQMGTVNNNILDSTPIKSIRVLGSGMQSGMTSPAKRWFRLGHPNPEIEEFPSVKEWLEGSQRVIFNTMSRSNFYNNIHRCYIEVAVFGTFVLLILEDEDKIIRTICLPIGSYVLSSNAKQEIDTLFRKIYMTAEQIVDEFGKENTTLQIQNAFMNIASKGKWFPVIHAIKPNKNVNPEKDDVPSMAYESIYFEENPGDGKEKTLNRGGFREKPFVAGRWDVTGESVYGDSPAMDVLPFGKQIQSMTSTSLKVKHKNADPPLNVPPNMKTASTAPGALNYVKNVNEKISRTMDHVPDTGETSNAILDVRQQISEGLFNDIFRTLALISTKRMTATEVTERTSEGLRLLGPVLERLQFEGLDPTIDRIFAILLRRGLFQSVPAELEEGAILKTEYISPLAQAQKAVGTDSLNQLIGFSQAIADLKPDVLDNIDFDEMLRIYADLIGSSPKILNSSDEVKQMRALRLQQQQAALEQEQANQQIANLKQMSETEVTPGTNAIESAAEAVSQ